jgi:hypothetical protein
LRTRIKRLARQDALLLQICRAACLHHRFICQSL